MFYKLPQQFPFRYVTQGSRVVGLLYHHNTLLSEVLEAMHDGLITKDELLEVLGADTEETEAVPFGVKLMGLSCFKRKGNEDWTWLSFSSDTLSTKNIYPMTTISQVTLKKLMDLECTLYYDSVRVVVANETITSELETIFETSKYVELQEDVSGTKKVKITREEVLT